MNAYILYLNRTDAHRKLKHKEFRRMLVLALCEEQCSAKQSSRPRRRQDQTLERLRGSHPRLSYVQCKGSRGSSTPYHIILCHM